MAHHGGLSDMLHPFTEQPANPNKQQDLSEKDNNWMLSMSRCCGEEKRMRVENRHRKQRPSTSQAHPISNNHQRKVFAK